MVARFAHGRDMGGGGAAAASDEGGALEVEGPEVVGEVGGRGGVEDAVGGAFGSSGVGLGPEGGVGEG